MANEDILSKEEAKFTENIYGRLRDILALKAESIKLEKHLLKLEEERLKTSFEENKLEKDELGFRMNVVKAEEKILYSVGRQRVPSLENIRNLKSANSELNTFLKTQKKSLNLEEWIDKLGFSRVSKMVGMVGMVRQLGAKQAFVVIAAASMVIYLGRLVYFFHQIDKSAAEFRKSIGITRDSSKQLEAIARGITFDFAHVGITAADVYKSISAVTTSIGTSQAVTREMVKDMSLLSVQLGVAESTSAEFLRSMAQMGQSTMAAQSNIALFTAALSAAAGTNLSEVMSDVAAASKTSYQFMTRSPLALAKAAVEARRMGTSLESSARSSSSLLNFTQNVKDEMEASVLVGKSINLQKARELAYHRDIMGLNKEILNIAKQTDFENLDPFQQEAVAKSLGKSADEVAKMLQSDREMNRIRHDPSLAKQVAEYDRLKSASQAIADHEANSQEARLEWLANAEALKTISLAFHAILQRALTHIIVPIANVITFVSKEMNKFNMWAGAWAGWVGLVLDYLDDIAVWFISFKGLKYLTSFSKTATEMLKKFETLTQTPFRVVGRLFGSLISKLGALFKYLGMSIRALSFESVGKFFSKILKFLAPLIFAYHIFQEIMNIIHDPTFKGGFWESVWRGIQAVFKALWTTINDFFFGLPQMIANGLEPIGQYIFDAIIDGFNKAWRWVSKLWGGHSPSIVGLSIVEGILAVEDLILQALVSPFKKAWEFIKKLPIISKLIGGNNVASNIAPEAKATMTVGKNDMGVDTKKSSDTISDTVSGMGEELAKRMSSIVDAINALRDDMKNGSLTANVYIDSQKLDALMGRRLAYTGQLT